jgi:hypothetical protein
MAQSPEGGGGSGVAEEASGGVALLSLPACEEDVSSLSSAIPAGRVAGWFEPAGGWELAVSGCPPQLAVSARSEKNTKYRNKALEICFRTGISPPFILPGWVLKLPVCW